ncbi:hypothetical protein [Actinophytocola xanthii]|nr:hypothetical protein [Actinophytocola xanthii]
MIAARAALCSLSFAPSTGPGSASADTSAVSTVSYRVGARRAAG